MENLGADNEIYKKKYRIPSARMANWDYGSQGLYYVTICTKNRAAHFGEIVSQKDVDHPETQNAAYLRPSTIGEIANACWMDIPNHFPIVQLADFVIMPNHVHGIIILNNAHKEHWVKNKFGPQSQNLGSVIRGFKAGVKTFATKNDIDFEWQPRYHDHVIRNEAEYHAISNYIINNPRKWLLNGDDKDNALEP